MKSIASMPANPLMIGALRRLLTWAMILACWEAAFRLIRWNPLHCPAPSTLWPAVAHLLGFAPAWGARPLLGGVVVSLSRLAIGFTSSILAGGAIGMLLWRFHPIDDFVGPLFLGLQALPSVAWVPLAAMTVGPNEAGVVFVVIMGSVFAITIAIRDGLRAIPPIYSRAGMMLGTRGWRLYRHILLPASLPALSSGLRQGFAFAWRSLMGAELLFAVSRRGLGYLLEIGRKSADLDEVVVVMMVMVILAILVDRCLFAPLERKIHRRFGLGTA